MKPQNKAKFAPYDVGLDEIPLAQALLKKPTINFSIGPNCPVRCEGCYNHFGDTARFGGLVTADEVLDFATDAKKIGIQQTTLSGGDPLFHPEILSILRGLKKLEMNVKLDTVGTAFLSDSPIVFNGQGIVPKVDIASVAPCVDFVSIPLDGATQETVMNFRRGRSRLLAETREVARLLRQTGIPFGFNTVANASNISEFSDMWDIVEEEGAAEWQIFEYDSTGPNPANKKSQLTLAPGQFVQATRDLVSTNDALKIVCKSLEMRKGVYFLVDDSGQAWKPVGEGLREIIGHITSHRAQVLDILLRHIHNV